MFEFKIKNTFSAKGGSVSGGKKARTGFLITPRGKIETPNLAIVATHGKIKLFNKTDHLRANPDLTISNTFHLFVNNKIQEIKKSGGLHKWLGFKKPIMTDSGGFQVFSLGWGRAHRIGKVLAPPVCLTEPAVRSLQRRATALTSRPNGSDTLRGRRPSPFGLRDIPRDKQAEPFNESFVQISENGVVFSARGGSAFGGNFNGKEYKLTPEISIKIQQDLGADIIFAFDECTSPLHSYSYTKKSMERTHRWAVRCLEAFKVSGQKSMVNSRQQALFGIVQGGIFKDLRKKSSRFIGSLPFGGFGIGGSFGEKQMEDVLEWALSGLPEEKPRHLLGIGKIKDIFIAVKQGIDLFDCVVPTREARHGVLYTKSGKLAIKKGIFAKDRKLIEKNCGCWVCRNGITRRELREDYKNKKILGQRLATIHNIYFFKNLFREIREAIADKKLEKLEKEYYNYM